MKCVACTGNLLAREVSPADSFLLGVSIAINVDRDLVMRKLCDLCREKLRRCEWATLAWKKACEEKAAREDEASNPTKQEEAS